jgi:type VI secretion system protein ImpM
MPSVDRVGRYYPLAVAQRLPLDACLFQVAVDGGAWFDRAEALILTVLEQQDFDLDHFDSEVEKLEGMYRLAEAGGASTLAGYGSSWRIAMDQDVRPGQALPAMMHQLVLQRLGPYSIWWSSGSNSVQPSMLVCAEMPPVTDFSALLSGDWQHSAWEEWPMPLGGALSLENVIEEERGL